MSGDLRADGCQINMAAAAQDDSSPVCLFGLFFCGAVFSKNIVPQELPQKALAALEPLLPRQVFLQG